MEEPKKKTFSFLFYRTAFWKSLFDIAWLKSVKDEGQKAGVYFLSLILILCLVQSVVMTVKGRASLIQLAEGLLEKGSHLSVEVKDQVFIASGVTQPYQFEITTGVNSSALEVYIDTNETRTAQSIANSAEKDAKKDVIVLTKNEFFYRDQNHVMMRVVKASDITSLPNGYIFERLHDAMVGPGFAVTVFALLTMFLFVLEVIWNLVILTVIVGIIKFFARKDKTWTFQQLFTVGMFAITLPVLLSDLLPLVDFDLVGVPTALLLAYMALVTFSKKKGEA